MTKEEQKARELISNQTLHDLLDEWELTNKIHSPQIQTTCGWVMDELAKRNPQAFEKWLCESADYEDLRNYM